MQLKLNDLISFNIQKDYLQSKVVEESELLDGDIWVHGMGRAYLVFPSSKKLIYLNKEDDSSDIWRVLGEYPISSNARTLNTWVELGRDSWTFYRKNRVKKIYAKELE